MLEGLAENGPTATETLREWRESGLGSVPLRNFLLHRFGQEGRFRPDRMRDHVDSVFMRGHHEALMARHASVGAVRNIGLFGIIELVRDRATMEPLSAFNTTSEEMQLVMRALLDQGLYTITRWHAIMTNPPLNISEEQLDEGFQIIDRALDICDRAAAR